MKTNIFKQSQTNEMFSTHLALGSFGIGTLLLVLYLLFPREDNLLIMGFFYVLFAAFANGIVFLSLLFKFCFEAKNREMLSIKMLIMLANIPITILYFYIAMHQNYSSF